jgi:hypothetical protein
MVEWLRDEFGVAVTKSSVIRTLHSVGRSKKKFRRNAAEQNPDLIDYYLHSVSSFRSYQFVYVDECGCDTLDGLHEVICMQSACYYISILLARNKMSEKIALSPTMLPSIQGSHPSSARILFTLLFPKTGMSFTSRPKSYSRWMT